MRKREEKIEKYFKRKKSVYDKLLDFIEDANDIEFDDLKKLINKNIGSQEELEFFLHLLISISNNHRREPFFFTKIEQILIFLKNSIKQTLSNDKLYQILLSNKTILHLAAKNEILTCDKGNIFSIFTIIQLRHFSEKMLQGENDSYICSLIREDSVEESISHINKYNLSFNKHIEPLIYETNQFLIGKNPTLIEYSAFFGSIRIFNYLVTNKAELKPSLWLYTIHSNNAEIIQFLIY